MSGLAGREEGVGFFGGGVVGREHVAILRAGYAALVASGVKRVECRLSRTRRVPFGAVSVGDVVWVKRSGGGFVARGVVVRVEQFEGMGPTDVAALSARYNGEVLGEAEFWESRSAARYATLVWLGRVRVVEAGPGWWRGTGGRHAWVVGPEVEVEVEGGGGGVRARTKNARTTRRGPGNA